MRSGPGLARWCLPLSHHSSRSNWKSEATITNAEEADAVFFSPAAIAAVAHLIAICGAEPSPPLDRACATLFVGTTNDRDLLPRQAH
jgi:hypothetical protein